MTTRACANARAALDAIYRNSEAANARRRTLTSQLVAAFPGLSVAGQQCVLTLTTGWLISGIDNDASPDECPRLLSAAAYLPDPGVHRCALDLAALLVDRTKQPAILDACREVIGTCLRDADPETRTRALQLALLPQIALPRQLIPLLSDPVPEIRRIALLAIGPRPEVIETDELLPWLHDPDGDVRRLCEKVLRSRGLRQEDIKLARLKTDADPHVRLQLVQRLPYVRDLDLGIWLRSLSHDPTAAVRTAVLRAAADSNTTDLTDRMDQMAQNDPSLTVRQVARFYLSCQKPPERTDPIAPPAHFSQLQTPLHFREFFPTLRVRRDVDLRFLEESGFRSARQV